MILVPSGTQTRRPLVLHESSTLASLWWPRLSLAPTPASFVMATKAYILASKSFGEISWEKHYRLRLAWAQRDGIGLSRRSCTRCCSWQATAGWQTNLRRIRKWREIQSLHFLIILSLYPFPISKIVSFFQKMLNTAFCRECHKKLNILAMRK